MRRMTGILLALSLLCAAPASRAEGADLFAWTLSIGEAGMTTPAAMAPAPGGGVFIVGTTTGEDGTLGETLGETDAFVVYVDGEGRLRWQQRLGGSGEDALTAVAATPDGGCVAIGTTLSMDGDARAARGGQDAWMVRFSRTGELRFSKCLGGSLDDELLFLTVTDDGDYFVCGRTQSRNEDLRANLGGWDAWAMLISDEDGKPIWTDRSFRFGEGGDDVFTQARPVSTGGWLLMGQVAEEISRNTEDEPIYRSRPVVQRITEDGEAVWEEARTLGDTGDNVLHAIVETETGWLLGGETNSRSALMPTSHGGKDIWLVHMRQSGTVSRQSAYGGSREELLHSITPLADGGHLLLGETKSIDGQAFGAHSNSGDLWVVEVSPSGVLEWQQPIGGSDESTPAGLLVKSNGDILVAGTTLAQDGDMGRHDPVRAGFLSWLAPNGNLLGVALTHPEEECTLLQLTASGDVAYLLGYVQAPGARGAVRSVMIARLAEEGFAAE